MARPAPRHLKPQSSVVSRVAGRRGTALATGAVLTVPGSAAAVAMADSASALAPVPQSAPAAAPSAAAAAAVTTAKKATSITLTTAMGGSVHSCGTHVVRYGSVNSAVKVLQSRLGVTADGRFGPRTLAAVRAFQARKGLVRDGVVGPLTWKKLGGYPCGSGGGTGPSNGGTTPPTPAWDSTARYRMPFPAGVWRTITQGPGGNFSHDSRYDRYAVDFRMPTGAAVVASRGGTVYKAGWDRFGGGNSVMVRDATGYCMQYNHLSRITVSPGQRVGQGQLVGRAGSTGNSTGPHLHWGLVTCAGYVSVQVPRTVERGTSYPAGIAVASHNG